MIAGGLARTGAGFHRTALAFPVGERAGVALHNIAQEHGTLRLGWLVNDNRNLLSLSAQFGLFFGTLRTCTRAGCGRVFLAESRGHHLCAVCNYIRTGLPLRVRRAWHFMKDRFRKRVGGRDRIREAEEDLYALRRRPDEWLRRWDTKDPLGRGRPRGIPGQHGRQKRAREGAKRG